MKTREFIELEKRILPNFPGFAIKGKLFFVSPIEGTLRGFHFESSAFTGEDFHVNMFFLPLCVPVKRVHFTFGHRVGNERRWNRGEANLQADLASEMLRELPFLFGLKTPRDMAKALEPLTKRPNLHSHEAFAYTLIQAGEIRTAGQALDTLLKLVDLSVRWHQEIASRARLVREKLQQNVEEARKQLGVWESETVSNLGLQAFRSASDVSIRGDPWDSTST